MLVKATFLKTKPTTFKPYVYWATNPMAVPIRKRFSRLSSTSDPGMPRAGTKPGLLLPSGLRPLPSEPRTLRAEAELTCGPIPIFRVSEFFLPSSDTRRSIATQKNLSAFYKGLAALGVEYERTEAPYGSGHRLPMNYYSTEAQNREAQNRKNTLLILIPC